MDKTQKRIKEVFSFFENNDTVLGFRKLMDCVMDTQDLSLYKEVIDLTDWKEKNSEDVPGLVEKSKSILDKLANIVLHEYNSNQMIVHAKGIEKNYGRNRFRLGPISLDIKKGQVYGLVGENGNGKTTLLRVLAKELKTTAGEIDFHFDKPTENSFDLRTHLVYIPQRTQRWYGSLKDNLKFVLSSYGVPSEENEIRVLMMIARFGLWNYKHLKWDELSSGYKMRFELARTMLRQPELLLLDEPLANLDVLAQQVILEDLKSICNSITQPVALILSSQQLYEVEKISDKVIYLKDGQYTENNHEENEATEGQDSLIIEIDCACERNQLTQVFKEIHLERLLFNGGVFIAYFKKDTPFFSVLEALGKHKVEVTYTRNITHSTRRFFVS